MKLGMSMRGIGYHVAAWRHPDVPADGTLRFEHYVRNAQAAERGKFDMIFFADGIGIRERDEPRGSLARSGYELVELEPMTLLPALAPLTKHIGLVTTASTTYNEPYHVARKFATLDVISGGRAGWNVVTSWSEAEARNFNREEHLEYDTRYDRAKEFVEVVTGLWDSWEQDAFVYDKASGQFYDESRMHVLDHRGKHFQVRGPLNVAGMPQGRPILVQAGASEQGREIAAAIGRRRLCRAGHHRRRPGLLRTTSKRRMAKYGRDRDDDEDHAGSAPDRRAHPAGGAGQVRPAPGAARSAGRPRPRLQRARRSDAAIRSTARCPEPTVAPQVRSSTERIMQRVRRENLTIRQLCQQLAGAGGFVVIGTRHRHRRRDGGPGSIANACDGFNITPTHLPGGCEDFVDLVIPGAAAPRPFPHRIRRPHPARKSRPEFPGQPLHAGPRVTRLRGAAE